jgi:nucleoredoxin
MAGIAALLGAKLLSKDGEVSTETALQGKKCIALYFSAHWCPPCRGFTPKFAEWYKTDLQAKGLEVVFVSSDRDEAAFKEYYGEQPWLAVPFVDRDTKAALDKKYKVQGIPSVVVLGPDGELITNDGREAIGNDPTGSEMPWKPKTFSEIFDDAKLVGPGGIEKKGSDLAGSVVGLYFSAHWCPPCRGFTPQLAEWYNTSLKAKGFEVVFVSSDRDGNAFKEYSGEQPWLALDFSDRKRKEQLSSHFKVEGIPSFVILDKDGSVITKDGRAAVSADPTGAEFPWYPKPVSNLKLGPGNINEVPTVIAFCEGADAATQKAAEAAMEPIAKRYIEEAKSKGEDDPHVAFAIATESEGLEPRLREVLGLAEPTKVPKLMLVDIKDEGGFYDGPEGEVTTAIVQKFVDDCLAKSITRKQLSKM